MKTTKLFTDVVINKGLRSLQCRPEESLDVEIASATMHLWRIIVRDNLRRTTGRMNTAILATNQSHIAVEELRKNASSKPYRRSARFWEAAWLLGLSNSYQLWSVFRVCNLKEAAAIFYPRLGNGRTLQTFVNSMLSARLIIQKALNGREVWPTYCDPYLKTASWPEIWDRLSKYQDHVPTFDYGTQQFCLRYDAFTKEAPEFHVMLHSNLPQPDAHNHTVWKWDESLRRLEIKSTDRGIFVTAWTKIGELEEEDSYTRQKKEILKKDHYSLPRMPNSTELHIGYSEPVGSGSRRVTHRHINLHNLVLKHEARWHYIKVNLKG